MDRFRRQGKHIAWCEVCAELDTGNVRILHPDLVKIVERTLPIAAKRGEEKSA